MSEKSITLLSTVYGEKSKKLSGKHYQKANCCLFLQRKDEAIEHIEIAIDIFHNPEPDRQEITLSEEEKILTKATQNPRDKEQGFSRIQY